MSAPLITNPEDDRVIPGSYIVVLKESLDEQVVERYISDISEKHSGRSSGLFGLPAIGIAGRFQFPNGFQGYIGGFDEDTVQDIREQGDIVGWIEQDSIVSSNTIQNNSTWGLDRISHKSAIRSRPYRYQYDENAAGKKVIVYVADTGLRTSHNEFKPNRAFLGFDAYAKSENAAANAFTDALKKILDGVTIEGDVGEDLSIGPSDDDLVDAETSSGEAASEDPDEIPEQDDLANVLRDHNISDIAAATNNNDFNGHGTHVAGTVAGTKYGVAKKARVCGVKVLDNSGHGTTSKVIQGLEWIAQNATPNKSVANMSLGGGKSNALNAAVDFLVDNGIFVAVSAGNKNSDAKYQSPASARLAYTVAAIDPNNIRASFSNYGECVNIFAPGVAVWSAGISSDTAIKVMSGTSMACPHVSGLAACFISGTAPLETITPADTQSYLNNGSVKDQVSDPKGSKNQIAYNGQA
ncbi:Oryzin [Arthrobotrys entomopaga]|nr:Oryzin [Arthrobotrys entomopaga]